MNLFKSLHPSYDDNILRIYCSLLGVFEIKYTNSLIMKVIGTHLKLSSLLAINDLLSEYGVEK